MALKSAMEGLNTSILGQLDLLYNDVKAYASREIINLIPKIDGNISKCEVLEMASSKHSGDITSLRREINDRYDYLVNRISEMNSEIRELKEKQGTNGDNINQIKEELRKINEKLADSAFESNDKLRNISEKIKIAMENAETMERKIEKQLIIITTENKRNFENIKNKSKETDDKYQEQNMRLKGNIEEHAKDIDSIVALTNQINDKLYEAKSELSFRQDDMVENFNIQIKKISIAASVLTDKLEKSSESHQFNLEEINKSFGMRLESLSKTLMNELKKISECVYKNEKNFDRIDRESKIAISNLERGLIIQDEKLNLSLGNKYR